MYSVAKKVLNVRFIVAVVFFCIVAAAVYVKLKPKQLVARNGTALRKFTVSRRNLVSAISLSGTVDAQEKVTLQFQSSGKLAWVGVKEGDIVKKWQVLASLDQRALRKSLEKDLRDFSTQRLTIDQFRDDNKAKQTSQTNSYLTDQLTRLALQSQNALDKTVLNVELDTLTLELSNLVTPIDGIVTQIDQPFAGVNITPATARFSVVNPNTLYLLGTVDQQDVSRITIGAPVNIVFDTFPDTTYKGNVNYIAFASNSGDNNSYSVKISLPEEVVPKLRLSMGAEATIVADSKRNVLAVPLDAVSDENGKKYVTVINQNIETKKRVYTGLETDEYVQITRGVSENDIVLY